jgi:hypothetical protein
MFNIFEEEKRGDYRTSQSLNAIKKVEHPQLQDAVGALRVRASMEGITFTECANHLSARRLEFPDHQTPRKVSATASSRSNKGNEAKRIRGGDGVANAKKINGIQMPDGSIWTGFYSDWSQLSKDDRQKVMETPTEEQREGR